MVGEYKDIYTTQEGLSMRGNKGLRNGMFALVIAVILGAFGWSPAAYGGKGPWGILTEMAP